MKGFTGYDFIDFGCSNGGSITYVQRLFPGAKGIGLDIDSRKVNKARELGHHAEVCDVTNLVACPNQVRFVTMSHFLEHLPGRKQAFDCLRAASIVATDFVMIRQPWFDADGYLFGAGLKFYWSDWRGHRYHMSALELQRGLRALVDEGVIERFVLYGNKAVHDSSDPSIHPLSSPTDQHEWDKSAHDPKPIVTFGIPVFRELCAIAVRAGCDIDDLARKFKLSEAIFRSDAPKAV